MFEHFFSTATATATATALGGFAPDAIQTLGMGQCEENPYQVDVGRSPLRKTQGFIAEIVTEARLSRAGPGGLSHYEGL
jgi:hypothetical protein